jgi:hypothetical protein
MAVKSRPQRQPEQQQNKQDPAQKYDERFLDELKNLSQQKPAKYDMRRKLHLLFEKYELNHSQRRDLFLFADGINADSLLEFIKLIG